MDRQKKEKKLKRELFKIVEKHYEAFHKPNAAFRPGRTYIPYAGRVYDADEMKTLAESCMDFWLTAGRFANRFEKGLARFLGARFCMLTNSGSSANLLAMSALTSPRLGSRRLCPGDEVITTACAFPTTVGPIVQNKMVPVFVDVELGSYNVNPRAVLSAINKKTKAIFLAHTLGNPFDAGAIARIARKHKLWLIEDNSDALGAKYGGRYTGTFGDIATFSFYPAHHITTGEGGALVTNDFALKRIITSFRDWGRDCWCEPGSHNTCGRRFGLKLGDLPSGYDHKYVYSHIGYNLKITDMQAAIGVAQLKKLKSFIKARRENWNFLYQRLKRHEKYFILPESADNSHPSWFGFILSVREGAPFKRNDIVKYLESNRIATRMLFAGNIIRHPAFRGVKHKKIGKLDNTDYVMRNTFWIGVYPGMSKKMLEFMSDKIGGFINERA